MNSHQQIKPVLRAVRGQFEAEQHRRMAELGSAENTNE
jgi:hypothetical protein